MNKKFFLIIVGLFILILIILAKYRNFNQKSGISNIDYNCINNSGIISTTTGQYGNSTKVCILNNGAICDIIEYYLKQCPTKLSLEITGNLSALDGHGKSMYIPKLSIVINYPIAVNEIKTSNSGILYLAGIDTDPRINIKRIENPSLTKNITNKICPKSHRECRFKTMGSNQILYMYGVNKSGFFDYNLYILNSGNIFSIQDHYMEELIKKDRTINTVKFSPFGSFKKPIKNSPPIIRETIVDAIFYGHWLMDSIRNPRD